MYTRCRYLIQLPMCFLCLVMAVTIGGCQQQQPSPVAQQKDAAARLAALQQQEQQAAAQAQHDADLKKQVEANKKKSNAYYVARSKTWQKYIP